MHSDPSQLGALRICFNWNELPVILRMCANFSVIGRKFEAWIAIINLIDSGDRSVVGGISRVHVLTSHSRVGCTDSKFSGT